MLGRITAHESKYYVTPVRLNLMSQWLKTIINRATEIVYRLRDRCIMKLKSGFLIGTTRFFT
jgi:hypothetical protein